MTEKNVEIEIQVLLPEIENTSDDCIVCLLDSIRDRKGILHVHLIREDGTVSLCVHYDPNLISLKSVRKLAQRIGSSLTNRYRHERIPFEGMDNADEASILRRKLESLTGMLHASVNYAAGLAFVAYDTNALRPEIVANTMKGMGIKPLDWPQTAEQELDTHDHGSAPDFLPHWVQERWTLILVGLAGLFLLIGWAGEKFFELPSEIALIFSCCRF